LSLSQIKDTYLTYKADKENPRNNLFDNVRYSVCDEIMRKF